MLGTSIEKFDGSSDRFSMGFKFLVFPQLFLKEMCLVYLSEYTLNNGNKKQWCINRRHFEIHVPCPLKFYDAT